MSKNQGDVCLICGRKPERLCVDHDHLTGVVRGLLCQSCSKALAFVKDSSSVLRSLANDYLPWCERLAQGLEERVTQERYHSVRSPEVRKLLSEQHGERCMACGETDNLCVDHDHKTRLVRGLLCGGCNLALGHAGESAKRLIAMSEYLEIRKGGV
jgi:hypothetical protein